MIKKIKKLFKRTQQEMQIHLAAKDTSKHVEDRLRNALDLYIDECLMSLQIDPRKRNINRHTQNLPLGLIETIYVDNTPTIAIEVQYPYMGSDNYNMEWDVTVRVSRLI